MNVSRYEYLGKMPDVVIQAPIVRHTANSGLCTGCNNVIHYLDYDKAICPVCIVKSGELNG